MFQVISDHWVLAMVLLAIAIFGAATVWVAINVGDRMFDEFFGPPA